MVTGKIAIRVKAIPVDANPMALNLACPMDSCLVEPSGKDTEWMYGL